MVLSNKKLKQKLRAELTQSLAKNSPSNNSNSNPPNPEIPKSLKQLLDSAANKPRLSKREKRRKALNLQSPEVVENGSNAGSNVAHVGETENRKGKKRKREKKRSEDQKNGGVDEESDEKKEGGDLKKEREAAKKNAKKRKKKQQQKKKKKREKQEKLSEIENRAADKQSIPENVEYNNSDVNEVDTKKVYVGGIPYYSTEDDIRSYFDHCGTITEVDCMTFPESGKFRGIAMLSFKTEEAAKRALALDGSDMGGLYLKISPYKSNRTTIIKTDFSPPVTAGYNRIYAGNLSWDITEDDLKKLFSDCNISTIQFGEDKETGELKGYAHVDFADHASLTKALKLDQRVVCGRPVKIRCAVPLKKADVRNAGSSASSTAAVKTETEYSEAVNENENANSKVESENNNNGGGISSGKLRRRTCYECGEKGHLSSACPKKQAAEQNPGAS